jgi:hypothetical protein
MTVQRPPTLLTTRITGGESPTEVCQSPAFGTHVICGKDPRRWAVSTHCPHIHTRPLRRPWAGRSGGRFRCRPGTEPP